ncbi:MAG: aminotransferase class I/II-fold pyridoxal phosphate-dependent enzyme, partial [Candidatus Nitrotoga sp.]
MLRPWNLTIQLQRQNGKGLHLQITQAIIEEIRRSRLILGMPMPGSRELAEKLCVNRKTVVLAYEELVAQGWLQAQGRRGTFVAAEFPVTEKKQGVKAVKSNIHESAKSSNELFLEEGLDSGLQPRPDVINFNDGTPDSRLIPYTALSRAFRHAIIQTSRTNQLGYGDPRGSLILRQSLARMLKMERGLSSNEENICLVRGSQMGIYIAASVLVNAGDYVAFEALSYAQARNAFRSFGANIVSVAQDQYGLIPEDLE